MALEPKTDREIMIQLSGEIRETNLNMQHFSKAVEGFASSLKELETTKVKDHEERIGRLEKIANEGLGIYKFIGFGLLILSIISLSVALMK
jgi:uncharacterized membrane protein YukC